jgi:transposase InsO family protein
MTARSTFPRVRAIECFDPLALLPALSRLRHAFLLHSTLGDDHGRWSFFGAEPFAVFRGGDAQAAIDAWRSDYNTVRHHRSLDMATPASRFRPAPATWPSCGLPLSTCAGTGSAATRRDAHARASARGGPCRSN